jgi:hypothetical protein
MLFPTHQAVLEETPTNLVQGINILRKAVRLQFTPEDWYRTEPVQEPHQRVHSACAQGAGTTIARENGEEFAISGTEATRIRGTAQYQQWCAARC